MISFGEKESMPRHTAFETTPHNNPMDHRSDAKNCQQTGPSFRIVSERVAHSRYIDVLDRVVEYPNGEQHSFDIASSRNSGNLFVTVFPFRLSDNTVHLIKEFCQGALPANSLCYTLPCGGYDQRKHESVEDAALAELSEELQMKTKTLIRLIPPDHPGLLEVKWCRNRFIPFLALDIFPDPQPAALDAEEYIEKLDGVSFADCKKIISNGEMLLPSGITCFMAMEYLQNHGYLG
jgi:hypothetical protein